MYYQSAPEGANAAEKARMESYEKCRHIPISTPRKYSFDFINKTFDHKEVKNDIGKVIISYKKYFPVDYSSAVFLVCANADKMNAGYPINYRVTQEGQIFHDTDVFASDLRNLYPFNFDRELLYVENVTFHNHEDWQIDISSFRQNDLIFAASKQLKQPYKTDFIKEKLEKIIDSIFKIALIKNKKRIYLWPLGCGEFKNNPRVVADIFAGAIKKYKRWFREIIMTIYDKERMDKSFNTFFINALKKTDVAFNIY